MTEPATKALHAGSADRGVGAPVLNVLSPAASFFSHPDAVGFSANEMTDKAPYFYSRWSNPTTDLLAERLASLDGGEAGLVFASGMAAVTALFLGRLKAGDHLVLSNVCYAGVAELAHDLLPGRGIAVTAVDTTDLAAVAAAITPRTRLIHVESPANPILRLTDIAAVAEIARAAKVEMSVDSTMATPLGIRPLALGADFVIHSLTKYIGGHGDALGGSIVGAREPLAEIQRDALIHYGAALNPFAAWLILRGLETLSARMAVHQANAEKVAAFLSSRPGIAKVYWPGLASHPQHDLARRQLTNFSGMIAFTTEGNGTAIARRLAEKLEVVAYAVSLGKTRSLLCYIPSEDIIRSSFRLEGRDRQRYLDWTGEGTFRLSVGLEDAADIIADLDRALG